jgi:hypothetical protein
MKNQDGKGYLSEVNSGYYIDKIGYQKMEPLDVSNIGMN